MPDCSFCTLATACLAALALSPGSAAAQEAAASDGPALRIEVASGPEAETAGEVVIQLLPEVAPQHVERLTTLAERGAYDDIVFHRVIEGFMAQTGDVQYGVAGSDLSRAGTGGSDLPDLPAEFSDIPFERGTVGMARAAAPDSANSQFFIMFEHAPSLDGEYTVVGQVIDGMDVVDDIAPGDPARNGVVAEPDLMQDVTVGR